MRPVLQILISMLAMFIATFATAQQFETTSSLRPGYWTFGINAGKAYQSSDVRTQWNGYGFGLTLGKNLYYRPDAALSFDIRSRLFYGRSFGLDPMRSFTIENNDALNGTFGLDYTRFPEETGVAKGFVFPNHRTDLAELGLEGVLTLNRLKERTGVKVSLYGGIGADWYNVKIDQAGADGQEYFDAYAKLNDRAPTTQILKNLRSSILDGTYETYADEFDGGMGKMKFMPSLGAEIGFQVTPKFSIDFGHRFTFSGTDLLDGQQWRDGGNDLHHYTYAGLNFNINKQVKRSIEPPVHLPPPPPSYNPPRRAPDVDITRPAYRINEVTDPRVYLEAVVRNVDSDREVEVFVNGSRVPFEFDPRRERLHASFDVWTGENSVVVRAYNEVGRGEDEVVVIYRREVREYRPEVDIIQPVDRTEVFVSQVKLTATVRFVESARDITLAVNGRTTRDFHFDQDRLTANVALQEGHNVIEVRGDNRFGYDEDEVTVIYKRQIREKYPPTVQITEPADRSTVHDASVKFYGKVTRIERADQVELTLNGSRVHDFKYIAGTVTATLTLGKGSNTIRLKASNGDGFDEKTVLVNYQPAIAKPTLEILDPAHESVTDKNSVAVRATVLNVTDSRNITLKVNGTTAHFEYYATDKTVRATVRLKNGANRIEITAANEAGTASDAVTVHYKTVKVVDEPQHEVVLVKPTVKITIPADRSVTDKSSSLFRAEVQNVTAAAEITLKVNGVAEKFDFFPKEKVVKAALTLKKGINKVEIVASTEGGTASAAVTVEYKTTVVVVKEDKIKAPPAAPKPVITLLGVSHPTVDPMNPTDARSTVTAKIEFVKNREDVSVTMNGTDFGGFDFDATSGQFSATVPLRNGDNLFVLKASNESGEAELTKTIPFGDPFGGGDPGGSGGKGKPSTDPQSKKDKVQKPATDAPSGGIKQAKTDNNQG